MAQVGRISGPLLKANLERQGIDLAFKNVSSSTPVLFLDVNNNRIGINYNGTPLSELYVPTKINTTSATIDNTAQFQNWTISPNGISISSGDINLITDNTVPSGSPMPPVRLTGFGTGTTAEQFLAIRDNNIGSVNNSDIVLDPAGTGTVEFPTNLNVDGNMFATGNIRADGNLTLGSGDEDDIVIGAELVVDLVPDSSNTYKIGEPGKQFDNFFGNEITMGFLNGVAIKASGSPTPQPGSSTVQNLGLDIGNTFFVSQNGNDSDAGFHPAGPFRTIKRALDAADASTSGPVTIRVSPGSFEEITPLVVPANVTIIGEDMRNTIIRPESAYQSNDIFLLEDNTTIMNLTIQDFYYDSGNDTGYAFKFNSQARIATRSPYIQNVTVITKGTTTSASDPRGFASGDAGKGALVDGAALDIETDANQASMLFHSVTFITPGVDALTCKNGVRVEWLNCFTYFANIGINCQNGTGRTTPDSATKTGVELRSIASACVYGNTGIRGDGNNVLIYAINHNLAYIGTGKFVDNDPSRANQTQEVVKLNSAKVYFTSQDHTGDFRVGDQFFIDLENGTTSLDVAQAQFDNLNSLQITTGGSTTEITPTSINVGDFLLSGNTVKTLSNNFLMNSNSTNNKINFLGNVTMPSLDLDGELIINGNFYYQYGQIPNLTTLDDDAKNIIPYPTNTYNIGASFSNYKNLHVSEVNSGNIRFIDNKITNFATDENLNFGANGTGKVSIKDSDFELTSGNFLGNGANTFSQLQVNGNFVAAGGSTLNFLSGYSATNFVTEDINVSNETQLEDIKFDGTTITTTASNSNLDLNASGTGKIEFYNLTTQTNLNINNTLTFSDNNFTRVTAKFDSGNIKIYDNVIETTESNSDLELRSYTGKVKAEDVNFQTSNTIGSDSTDVEINANLVKITGSNKGLKLGKGTTAQQDNILGGLRFNTDENIFEGYVTGWLGFNGLYSDDKQTRVIAHPTDNTLLFKTGGVNQGTIDSTKLTINGLQADEVLINGNTITSANSNADLELEASGNGYVFVDDIEFQRSKIIATTTNDNLTFSSTGDGYWKLGGTTGVVIPVVDDSGTEPGVQGQLRWNALFGKLEVFTGSIWENGAGFIETVPTEDANEINFEQSLIFG